MRLLDTVHSGIVRLAFGGNGRLLLVTSEDNDLTAWDWVAGEPVLSISRCLLVAQAALSADCEWLACFAPDFRVHRTDRQPPVVTPSRGEPGSGNLAGGVAFSPDGRFLVAAQYTPPFERFVSGRLLRWSTANWHPEPGFAIWPPFDRLAFDLGGEFLAGINPVLFELRVAVTGGIIGGKRPSVNIRSRQMHLSFASHGGLVAFGWNTELHIMDTGSGNVVKTLYDPDRPFRDVSFTADGRRFATVSDDGTVKIWDTATWEVQTQYDWQAGPLRCVAFSPDGACGVCGTADGKLIVFDVDG